MSSYANQAPARRPNIEHLKHQAKDLIKDRDAGDLHTCQRIREFHPRYSGMVDNAIRAINVIARSRGQRNTVTRESFACSWMPVKIRIGTTPERTHSHSTPLHQAALAGHLDVVRLLVERGASVDIWDIHYKGTALDWAQYAGQAKVAEFLRTRSPGK